LTVGLGFKRHRADRQRRLDRLKRGGGDRNADHFERPLRRVGRISLFARKRPLAIFTVSADYGECDPAVASAISDIIDLISVGVTFGRQVRTRPLTMRLTSF
jgi:hypothetical protein